MLSEVLRRFFGGEAPLGPAMMTMAAVNAGMNLFCLRLLKRHKGKDVNFKASSIFTSNDSIVNLAIVASGALVMWLGSNLPDLILGMVVSAIAFKGGREILAEARESTQVDEADAS
jgi:Co/Zn/Cd efflux system component